MNQNSPQVVKHVVKCEKWAGSTPKVGKNKPVIYMAKTRDFKRFCEKIKEKSEVRYEPPNWSEWRDSNSRHPAPKRLGKIFLLPKRRFSYVLLRKPNFLITIIPLIPTVIFLVLVKYVVKNVERWSGFAPPFLLSALGVYHKTSELSRQLLNLILRACRCHTWTNSPAAALK